MITFPGHGTPGKHCGETVYHGCWDCRDYFESECDCMMKSCPKCYEKWARRQGLHAAERLTNFMASKEYLKVVQNAERERWQDAITDPEGTVEERRLYRIQTYHIVVAFRDTNILDGKDIKRLRSAARKVCRDHGIFGECSIPHARHENDDGTHFHFLAIAGFIAPSRGNGDDYIFKVVKHENSWYPRNFLDRFNVVRYACTHAIITPDTHCVTWSGCVANNKFPGLAECDHFPQEQPMCPHCGGNNTFVVLEKDWFYSHGATVEIWTGPDRPPPYVHQRALREFS